MASAFAAAAAGLAPAHRSVTSIRAATHHQGQPGSSGTVPNTPPRNAPASYGSPSTIRADDDFLIVEIGSRFMRVGFAGDNSPKVALTFGPGSERRAGDFTDWRPQAGPDLDVWADDYEIWQCSSKKAELGLVYDRLDRMLRDAFMRFLLIDSRPRRVGLVLDSSVPIPLLSTVLDLMFKGFQAPMISLMSAATMTTVAAGIRSALVIDMGWKETVVTSVYEYREVRCTRTVRAGRFLHQQLYEKLKKAITGKDEQQQPEEAGGKRVITFAECEDVMHRLMWCRPCAQNAAQSQSAQLDTVVEQDESEADSSRPNPVTRIPLRSASPPTTVELPFDEIADICDDTFFDKSISPTTFDDHEVPVHLLVYQHLVQLPIDVRAVCMSRLIFTGGCSNILGIKQRVVDEVTGMVKRKGWANVSGKSVEETRNSHFSDRRASLVKLASSQAPTTSTTPITAAAPALEAPIPLPTLTISDPGGEQEISRPNSTSPPIDPDPIEAKVSRHRPKTELVQGKFRTIHSLGPWAGASLLCQLKVPAMATIDRELWLQQGASGASRPSEVDIKAQQRQSMGTGGFIRGSGGHHTNWTLGTWGYL